MNIKIYSQIFLQSLSTLVWVLIIKKTGLKYKQKQNNSNGKNKYVTKKNELKCATDRKTGALSGDA